MRHLATIGDVRRGDVVEFKSHALRVEEAPHVKGTRVRLSGRESRDRVRWYVEDVNQPWKLLGPYASMEAADNAAARLEANREDR